MLLGLRGSAQSEDNIINTQIGEDQFYPRVLFGANVIFVYLQESWVGSKNSDFYLVKVYDPDIEFEFVSVFERSDEIKLYANLTDWFKIDTLLRTYSPEWAVLVEIDGKEKLRDQKHLIHRCATPI